jgi:hypothetical protein
VPGVVGSHGAREEQLAIARCRRAIAPAQVRANLSERRLHATKPIPPWYPQAASTSSRGPRVAIIIFVLLIAMMLTGMPISIAYRSTSLH